MSNHRQSTYHGPSLVSIGVQILLAAAVAAVTLWISIGESDNGRELAGTVLGTLLGVFLVNRIAAQLLERQTVRDRAERRRESQVRRYSMPDLTPWPGSGPKMWPEPIEQPGPWDKAAAEPPTAVAGSSTAAEPVAAPVGEQTRRIVPPPAVPVPDAGTVYGSPTEAARTMVAVPVFRDEQDRQDWADRHQS